MSRATTSEVPRRLTDVNKIKMTRLAKHKKEFGSQEGAPRSNERYETIDSTGACRQLCVCMAV